MNTVCLKFGRFRLSIDLYEDFILYTLWCIRNHGGSVFIQIINVVQLDFYILTMSLYIRFSILFIVFDELHRQFYIILTVHKLVVG